VHAKLGLARSGRDAIEARPSSCWSRVFVEATLLAAHFLATTAGDPAPWPPTT